MVKRSGCSLSPRTARLLRGAVLCLLSVAFAGYLLYWFLFALDMGRMKAVEQWGYDHNFMVITRTVKGGYNIDPGRVLHPDLLNTVPYSP